MSLAGKRICLCKQCWASNDGYIHPQKPHQRRIHSNITGYCRRHQSRHEDEHGSDFNPSFVTFDATNHKPLQLPPLKGNIGNEPLHYQLAPAPQVLQAAVEALPYADDNDDNDGAGPAEAAAPLAPPIAPQVPPRAARQPAGAPPQPAQPMGPPPPPARPEIPPIAEKWLEGYPGEAIDLLFRTADRPWSIVPGKPEGGDGGRCYSIPVGRYIWRSEDVTEQEREALIVFFRRWHHIQVNGSTSEEQSSLFLQSLQLLPVRPSIKENLPQSTLALRGALKLFGMPPPTYIKYAICQCGFVYRYGGYKHMHA